jgi:paraquat-inducible protein B
MSEPATPAPPPLPGGALPPPVIVRPRRLRLSLVWIVPIVALITGAVLIVRTLLQSGPEITITFTSAEGIEPGRTELRFKEVVVGHVTRVTLSPDRQRVIVTAKLDKSVESLTVDDTKFWVVRPRVGTAGVSGLSTLFSGAYIGVDAGESAESRRRFTGLEVPPFVLRGEPGRSFVLAANDLGSLEVGSPVFYKRTRVGRVVGYTLDAAGDALSVRVFIEAPNERLVKPQTRFWNASGVDVTLNANGLAVNTESLASLVAGGVAFATPTEGADAAPAPDGQRFTLFRDRRAALAPPDGRPMPLRMVFEQSVRGLAIGAPVELLGVEIGSVRSVSLQPDRGGGHYPAEVLAEIFPSRLGAMRTAFNGGNNRQALSDDHAFMKRLVEHGLRAQVRTGNLLTGQNYVGLDFVPKAARATLDERAATPTVPSVPGTFSDLQPQLAEIVSRVSKIRFDEIGANLNQTLQRASAATGDLQETLKSASAASRTLQEALSSANQAIQQLSPEAQRALGDLRATLNAAQGTLGSFERSVVQPEAPLLRNANDAIIEMQRAARALRQLSDYLQQHPESLLRGKPPDPDLTKELPR